MAFATYGHRGSLGVGSETPARAGHSRYNSSLCSTPPKRGGPKAWVACVLGGGAASPSAATTYWPGSVSHPVRAWDSFSENWKSRSFAGTSAHGRPRGDGYSSNRKRTFPP